MGPQLTDFDNAQPTDITLESNEVIELLDDDSVPQ